MCVASSSSSCSDYLSNFRGYKNKLMILFMKAEKEMEEKEFEGIKKKETHPHGISSEVPTSPNFS